MLSKIKSLFNTVKIRLKYPGSLANSLEEAAQNRDAEAVRILIEEKADVHDVPGVLRTSILNGDTRVLKLLLESRADVHKADLLWYASLQSNGQAVIQMLLDYNADVHRSNNVALRFAARHGHVENVRVLLRAQANIHACDEYWVRFKNVQADALYSAIDRSHVNVVRLLLSAKAQLNNQRVNEEPDYAVRLAVQRSLERHDESSTFDQRAVYATIVEALLHARANVSEVHYDFVWHWLQMYNNEYFLQYDERDSWDQIAMQSRLTFAMRLECLGVLSQLPHFEVFKFRSFRDYYVCNLLYWSDAANVSNFCPDLMKLVLLYV